MSGDKRQRNRVSRGKRRKTFSGVILANSEPWLKYGRDHRWLVLAANYVQTCLQLCYLAGGKDVLRKKVMKMHQRKRG